MLDFCRKLTGKKAKAITEAVVEQTETQPEPAAAAPERRPRRTNAEYSRNDSQRPGRPPRERYDNQRQDGSRAAANHAERPRYDSPRPRRDSSNLGPKLNPDHQSDILPALRIISRDQHTISRKDISPNALKVLYRLNDAGFEAYLVGGCIRDLLLGLIPKDFDVVTNATPDEVRAVFKNCRLIGRRFRLAHVVFGREVIEVATFRGHHSGGEEEENIPAGVRSDHGQILRDNVYGTIEEDAERRDFSINALYYSVRDFAIDDILSGVAQAEVRLPGPPASRPKS